MSSVTQRISEITQPEGGYVSVSDFQCMPQSDKVTLNPTENIPPSVVGMVVDYMTRFIMGDNVEDAFKFSLIGARNADEIYKRHGYFLRALQNLSSIHSLNDVAIINACKLVTYDVWYRNPRNAFSSKTADDINPDTQTVENIKTMVSRCRRFFQEFGPVTRDGFDFSPDGYTNTVHAGDGDYLTEDTLWDFKVSKFEPSIKHTLQILMYWIMGQHSGQKIFKNITKIGIFNPRLNVVYQMSVNDIDNEIIRRVERDVIGY